MARWQYSASVMGMHQQRWDIPGFAGVIGLTNLLLLELLMVWLIPFPSASR